MRKGLLIGLIMRKDELLYKSAARGSQMVFASHPIFDWMPPACIWSHTLTLQLLVSAFQRGKPTTFLLTGMYPVFYSKTTLSCKTDLEEEEVKCTTNAWVRTLSGWPTNETLRIEDGGSLSQSTDGGKRTLVWTWPEPQTEVHAEMQNLADMAAKSVQLFPRRC